MNVVKINYEELLSQACGVLNIFENLSPAERSAVVHDGALWAEFESLILQGVDALQAYDEAQAKASAEALRAKLGLGKPQAKNKATRRMSLFDEQAIDKAISETLLKGYIDGQGRRRQLSQSERQTLLLLQEGLVPAAPSLPEWGTRLKALTGRTPSPNLPRQTDATAAQCMAYGARNRGKAKASISPAQAKAKGK
jgi:hypothetical protein